MNVHDQREKIIESLARVETHQSTIKSDVREIKICLKEQNGRIGKTENTVSKIIGIGLTAGVLATAAGAWAAGLF